MWDMGPDGGKKTSQEEGERGRRRDGIRPRQHSGADTLASKPARIRNLSSPFAVKSVRAELNA